MEITTSDLGLAARVQHLTKTYGAGAAGVRALDDVTPPKAGCWLKTQFTGC
jgi:putative ABC transport system ATP-binding protein